MLFMSVLQMQVLNLVMIVEILIKILGFQASDSFLDIYIGAECYVLWLLVCVCFLFCLWCFLFQRCKVKLLSTAFRQLIAILNLICWFILATQHWINNL